MLATVSIEERNFQVNSNHENDSEDNSSNILVIRYNYIEDYLIEMQVIGELQAVESIHIKPG